MSLCTTNNIQLFSPSSVLSYKLFFIHIYLTNNTNISGLNNIERIARNALI